MNREKLIAVISAICLAAGLMACGGADETAVNNASENTPTSQQEQASNGEAVQADAGTWQNNGETVNLEWFMSCLLYTSSRLSPAADNPPPITLFSHFMPNT